MTQSDSKLKINSLWLTLIITFGLTGVKFFAYFLTHSNAVLTDALESIVNIVAGTFALFSIYYASKPRDEDHPYGHGKIEFISAGFEGGLVFFTGIYLIWNALYGFFRPVELHALDKGIFLSAFAGIVNFVMGRDLIRRGKKYHSVTLVADGRHLLTDTISGAGVIAGLIIIYFTGLKWLDNLVAVILGVVILGTGYKLVRESLTGLLDEADTEKINLLVGILNKWRNEKWIDIHKLRVLKYGSQLHVDCHITLPWYDSLEDSHREVIQVEKLIRDNAGMDVEFFIHSDPCIPPESCTICQLKGCLHRKAEMKTRLEWTVSNMLPDKKHGL